MNTAPEDGHPGDSEEQRLAEPEILEAVGRYFDVRFEGQQPLIDQRVELDGFVDGPEPICVEIWAHQGPTKGGQPHKVMRDFCKLLLVEKLLKRDCKKVFAVCDEVAIVFLKKSWMGRFAKEFGIEVFPVQISEATRERIRLAQKRQFR